MNEVDPRFGQPRKTDDPSSELSHASDEVFNEWTKSVRKTFSSIYDFSEKFYDRTSAVVTCALGSDAALEHSREVERTANQALTNGNEEGAKHLLKRDLAYSMWTLGFDDMQTQSIKSQLDKLENQPQNQETNTPTNSSMNYWQQPWQTSAKRTDSRSSGVNSFAEMFKHL